MTRHRNPRARLPKRPSPDNFDPGFLIRYLYEDLVEVEALAVTADEAVTNLPPRPRGKYRRTLARLYTLVSKTSGRAQGALERGEELVALHEAHLAAQAPKRPRAGATLARTAKGITRFTSLSPSTAAVSVVRRSGSRPTTRTGRRARDPSAPRGWENQTDR